MHHYIIIIVAVLAIVLGAFVAQHEKTRNFESVDVATFEKALADSTVYKLDVRTASEYAEGHIPGVTLNVDVLSHDELKFVEAVSDLIPAGSTVALYCRSGHRSKIAAKRLASAGFVVIELSNGFNGWVASGKEVEK